MIQEADYFGNPLIGMFIRTGDEVTLVPANTPESLLSSIQTTLKTNIIKVSIYNSSLIGLFSAFNKNGIVLPDTTYSDEYDALSNYFDNIITASGHTAVGNLVAMNDSHAVVSPIVSKDVVEQLKHELDVDVIQMRLGGLDVVGSLLYLTNKGFLLSSLASDEEMHELSDVLGIDGVRTTINYGNPMVSSGLIANDNGAIVGSETTPFEMGRVDEALFLR